MKFTADVICSVAYGLDANALADPQSEFFEMSHNLFEPSWLKLWYITMSSVFPLLSRIYDMPFVAANIQNYFLNFTEQAIELRNGLPEKPDDYLNFLLKLKAKKGFGITDVAAHTTTYFLDAYETSSIVLTHALYRLAQKPRCQQKLRQEIATECAAGVDADVIGNLLYLDQVFNETLRISVPGFGISKVCTEQIELINYDGNPVTVEPGTIVHIPIYSIHNDPELHPNPDHFEPERFDSDRCPDLKTLRDEGIFFPFGHGPRICMGMRYSTLVIKAAIVEIVKHFEITLNPRTIEPVLVRPKDFLYMPIHNIFLDYKFIE